MRFPAGPIKPNLSADRRQSRKGELHMSVPENALPTGGTAKPTQNPKKTYVIDRRDRFILGGTLIWCFLCGGHHPLELALGPGPGRRRCAVVCSDPGSPGTRLPAARRTGCCWSWIWHCSPPFRPDLQQLVPGVELPCGAGAGAGAPDLPVRSGPAALAAAGDAVGAVLPAAGRALRPAGPPAPR